LPTLRGLTGHAAFTFLERKGVDGRDKPGHDGKNIGHHAIANAMIALC
jgi:hypothetical protein